MAEPSDGDSFSDDERPTQRPTRRRAAADTGPVEVMDSQLPTLPTDKTKAAERPAAGKSRRAFVTMLPDEPFSAALTFVSNIPPEGSIGKGTKTLGIHIVQEAVDKYRLLMDVAHTFV